MVQKTEWKVFFFQGNTHLKAVFFFLNKLTDLS